LDELQGVLSQRLFSVQLSKLDDAKRPPPARAAFLKNTKLFLWPARGVTAEQGRHARLPMIV
jgi:hypothetical protein